MNDESAGFVVLNATDKDCADIFVIGIKNSIKWVLDQYLKNYGKEAGLCILKIETKKILL
ncbi:hypothetical protein [Campylobacter concisus]|uniref:hypothetical protein n=1 Tax=Campylobacter concisus TaxID=199 RepID=UPI00122C5E07|nr:hypothetical protein [Campylobacter concisus]